MKSVRANEGVANETRRRVVIQSINRGIGRVPRTRTVRRGLLVFGVIAVCSVAIAVDREKSSTSTSPRVQADQEQPTEAVAVEQAKNPLYTPAVWRRTGPGVDAISTFINAAAFDASRNLQLVVNEMGGYFFVFSWNPAESRLVIEVDGEPLDDLLPYEDNKGRLAFHRAATDRHPELEGFLTLDPNGEAVLLAVTVDGQHVRFTPSLQLEALAPVVRTQMDADRRSLRGQDTLNESVIDAETSVARWDKATVWREAGPGRASIEATLNGAASDPSHVRTLWEGGLNWHWTAVLWDAGASRLAIAIDGERLDGLATFEDVKGRLAFECAASDRHPELAGFVTFDADARFVAIEITVDDRSYRLRRSLFSNAVASPTPDVSNDPCTTKSTCVCFGKGTSTRTCTTSNCDTGKSCGKHRACRWKAGCLE